METYVETQLTWVCALYNAIMYMLLDAKDFRLTVSALYKRRALFISFYAIIAVKEKNWKAISTAENKL